MVVPEGGLCVQRRAFPPAPARAKTAPARPAWRAKVAYVNSFKTGRTQFSRICRGLERVRGVPPGDSRSSSVTPKSRLYNGPYPSQAPGPDRELARMTHGQTFGRTGMAPSPRT